MTLLDYIVAGLSVFLLIRGLFKGFLGQLFGVIGVVFVAVATANLYVFPVKWMETLIADSSTRQFVALIATGVVLFFVYKLITLLLTKLITKNKGLGVLNRIIGMLLGIFIVYGVMAIVVSLLFNTADSFMPLIKKLLSGAFEGSWIVNNVYKNNFFGDWVVQMIVTNLQNAIPSV